MSLDDPAISAEMSRGNSFFAPGAIPSSGPSNPSFSTGLTPRKERDHLFGIGPTTASLLTPGLGLGLSSSNGGGLFGLGGSGTGLTPSLNAGHGNLFGSNFSTGLTPGRDANIAELKDFWKAFMKTPGERTPGVGGLGEDGRPSSSSGAGGGAGGHRGLTKVASLPDIKTPGGGSAFGHLAGYTANQSQNSNNSNSNQQGQGQSRQNFSGREDLRSYEMAVLARQAPRLTLVAPPKRRAGSMSLARSQALQSQQQLQQQHGQNSAGPNFSPPLLDSNASSPTSSSGTPHPPPHVPHGASAISRLVRSDRPSFKRIASSTLAPFESKSMKMSRDDGDEEAEWAEGVPEASEEGSERGQGQKQAQGGGQGQGYGGRGREHGHVRSPSAEYPPGYAPASQQHGGHGRRLSAPSGTAPVVI
ncbi:hypothetical protein M422DRAFT_44218 [Sphaerobolus stellatus SS14]|nr:hypothetical protein M422DRAFT_44218 [Sphaerobolus stellatus SS14]